VNASGTTTGVTATGPTAVNATASGATGVAVAAASASSTTAIKATNTGTGATHPAAGKAGDLYVDKTARLWFCKAGGATATWVA